MKKRLAGLLALLLAASLCGCGTGAEDYVLVRETWYSDDGSLGSRCNYGYDSDGNCTYILTENFYNGTVTDSYEQIITYNESGYPAEITTRDLQDETSDTVAYEYDGDMLPLSSGTTSVEYDASSELVHITWDDGDAVYKYLKGDSIHKAEPGNLFPNLLLLTQTINKENPDFPAIIWEYDGEGKLIEQTLQNDDGIVAFKSEYEYEYNEEGLPVKQIQYSDGEYAGYSEREYLLLSDYLKNS